MFNIILLQAIILFPNVASEDSEVEWEESINIEGNLTMENVRSHFQVNRTVVEIHIILTYYSEEGYANLDMHVEDSEGYHVNVSNSQYIPEEMWVEEFPTRGRWTLVIYPYACAGCGKVNYYANITLYNVVLPELEVSKNNPEIGKEVTLSINSPYENVTQYFFDFGDDTDSGWTNKSSVSITYNESGEYQPKAKVRYSDGTESDWVEVGIIKVEEEIGGGDLLVMAALYAVILAVVTLIAFLTFKISRKM
jgi:hypothetical protein